MRVMIIFLDLKFGWIGMIYTSHVLVLDLRDVIQFFLNGLLCFDECYNTFIINIDELSRNTVLIHSYFIAPMRSIPLLK